MRGRRFIVEWLRGVFMINLAEEWRKLDAHRRKPDAVAHWDRRAETYSFKDVPDSYLSAFIERSGIAGGERVLDMGCGTGSLALALASMGCSVVAADFSDGMLSRLRKSAAGKNLLFDEGSSCVGARNVRFEASGREGYRGGALDCPRPGNSVPSGTVLPLKMSWDDDWDRFGLGANSVDIAIASRSLITHDLEDSLRKLSQAARSRVCVTVGTGISPRVDMRVARAMGLKLERHNDALFVFGIVHDLGYEPTVSYIRSPRAKQYVSPDEAYCSLIKTKDYVADGARQVSDADCERRLRAFLSAHLVGHAQDGKQYWELDKPRVVPWAFIRWDVGDVGTVPL